VPPRHSKDTQDNRDAVAALRVQLSVSEGLVASFRGANESLSADMAVLRAENESLKDQNKGLRAAAAGYSQQLVNLQEELRWYQAQWFGSSSQRTTDFVTESPNQLLLFNLPDVEAAIESADKAAGSQLSAKVAADERKPRGKRKVIPPHFPRVLVEHDLTEAQKMCTVCAVPHPLTRIGKEEHECYRIKPAEITVEHHVAYTYVCEERNEDVVTAPAPPVILPKTNASPSLAAHLVTKKFDFSMPLHRTCRELMQSGLELSTATACRWVNTIGEEKVVPIVNLLGDELFSGRLMQMDETYLQVLKSHKAPTTDHFMVVRTGGAPGRSVVIYSYIPSRTRATLTELLIGPDGPYGGMLVTDGLDLYDDISMEFGLLHFGCWQHVRQYWYKADKVSELPSSRSLAHTALVDHIRPIFRVETRIEALRTEYAQRGQVLPSALVVQMRQEQSKPLFEAFKAWVDRLLPGTPPKSALGRALAYTTSQWPKLVRVLDHDVPIHNNFPEQQNKHFAVGRKNWWWSYGEVGARASANLLSLVLTCRANGVVVFDYLEYLFEQLPAATSLEHIEALLPWHVKPVLAQRRKEREDSARRSATGQSRQASGGASTPATSSLVPLAA
jgi:transposase